MFDPRVNTTVSSPHEHAAGRRNVLFVTPIAPWDLFGGTPTVARNLIELFSEEMDTRVCCLRSDETGSYPREIHGAAVLTGPVSSFARRCKLFLDFRPHSFAHRQFQRDAVRARFAALLAEQQPAAVVFDHIYSAWLIDLVENAATKIITIAHDDMVAFADSISNLRPSLWKRLRFASLRRQYRDLQAKVQRRSDLILTMTPEDAARFRPAAKGAVAVAPLHFQFPTAVRDFRPEFSYLLITGSFDTWEKKRGIVRFFTAILPAILKQNPEFRVVLAGRISADLRRAISLTEPELRIVQAPSAEEMREVVRAASAAVVLDEQASGLKIKTVEFAAAGLPLVSWPPGLEGTTLVSGESCLSASSTAEFIAHLQQLAAAPELRRRLGTRAQETIRANFSKERARERLRAVPLLAALSRHSAAADAS